MNLSHRARSLCIALTCALLVAGCDGSSSTSPTTNPPPNCPNPQNAYGAVCNASGQTSVGIYSPASGGTPIAQGNLIKAWPYSQMEFWISVKIRHCNIYPTSTSTHLTVSPNPGASHVIMHLTQGVTVCSTKNYPQVTLSVGAHARIHMMDPVFAAMISPAGVATIQVIIGTLVVSTDTGQSSVTLTAGTTHAQVIVDANGHIHPPTALAILPKAEMAAIQAVER